MCARPQLSEPDTQAPLGSVWHTQLDTAGLAVGAALSLCCSQAASPALQMGREESDSWKASLRDSVMRRKAGTVVKSKAALPEDLGFGSRHTRSGSHLLLQFQGSDTLVWLLHTYKQTLMKQK